MSKAICEYIWIDGTQPTAELRSKTKVLPVPDFIPKSLSEAPLKAREYLNWKLEPPDWGFDGSSTNQAEGHDSDCILKPVRFYPDPIRGDRSYLVLCEVYNPDGVVPHVSNTRAKLRDTLDSGAASLEPWFGMEQEYTFLDTNRYPYAYYRNPNTINADQGPYYCGVGADKIFGREIVEEHMQACIKAELLYEGANWEVAPGQAEFQIGAGDPLRVADDIWIARWLLQRIAEKHGVVVSFHPKPIDGKNGAGMHTNISTCWTRVNLPMLPIMRDGESVYNTVVGMSAITEACEKFRLTHAEHIAEYGADNALRLSGQYETCDINTFKYGVADRGCSIRIPRHVANKGYGYFEDRRPAANADPYRVCNRILKTLVG